MGKTGLYPYHTQNPTGPSSASVPRVVAKPKRQSKETKKATSKKAKKQQDADLAGIGSQFQQDNETQQLSSSADYP
ncbi:hypothetical protein F4823DRAFT_559670 [Ustulina deusta]|nr:hypothetical protein F4823DRAFT_559670 [Ustulina deusta]